MNKDVLLQSLQRRTQLPRRRAEQVLGAVLAALRDGLGSGERVELRHFGSFVLRDSEAHVGRHPRTGVPRAVPAQRCVLFRPSKTLRARLEGAKDAVTGDAADAPSP